MIVNEGEKSSAVRKGSQTLSPTSQTSHSASSVTPSVSINAAAGNDLVGDSAGGGFCDRERWSRLRRHQHKENIKTNSDDKVAVFTARNTMKEGTQDIDLHARGTSYFNVLTKSVGELNGLTDVTGTLWQTTRTRSCPCPFSTSGRTSRLKRWATFCPLRLRVRSEEVRREIY